MVFIPATLSTSGRIHVELPTPHHTSKEPGKRKVNPSSQSVVVSISTATPSTLGQVIHDFREYLDRHGATKHNKYTNKLGRGTNT